MAVRCCFMALTFATVYASSLDGRCPNGYFLVDHACYKVEETHPLPWYEAREMCKYYGGDLATPSDAYILQEVLLKKYGNFGKNKFWVGASDDEEEGNWRWVTGDSVDPKVWMPKQPNNCCGGENCAVRGTYWESPLNDNSCSNRLMYVCEVKAHPLIHEVEAA